MTLESVVPVVLAAGTGTRLQPYSDIVPKALMTVGDRPCIRWIVDELYESNIQPVVICVSKKDLKAFEYEFRNHSDNVLFSSSNSPQGTCGEILNLVNKARIGNGSAILVIYADDLTHVDYLEMIKSHNNSGKPITLAVTGKTRMETGVIVNSGTRLLEFYEKPYLEEFGLLTWTGRCIIEPNIYKKFKKGEDLASDIFVNMKDNINIFETDSEWNDIGNIQHYKRACELANKGEL
jgi:NDP-sugar pyrophosphorylase family protein